MITMPTSGDANMGMAMALMLDEIYSTLFIEEELEWARKDLADYGFHLPNKVVRTTRPK